MYVDVKQYLRGYIIWKDKAELLERQIHQLREDVTSCSFQQDGMPHGNSVSGLENYVAKLDELLRELDDAKSEAIRKYSEINNTLMTHKLNDIEYMVLVRRYLLRESWEEIAVNMGYHYRHVLRIHGSALENLKSSLNVT